VSERSERERDFHNAVFAEHGRAPLAKYYSVQRHAFGHYEDLISRGPAGGRALEYGCGPGSWAYFLAKRGFDVTGIDISDVAIEQATERAEREGVAERCTFRVMNAEHMDFEDSSFGLICGSAILHHLDLSLALPEIARTLTPRGHGVFLEALGTNPAINLYRRLTPRHRTPDEHPLVPADLELASQHFGSVEAEYFNFLTLAAVPLRQRPSFDRVLGRLDAADRRLFRVAALRRLAWTAVIELSQPARG
jgi:SAM-dependent methyltransferase